MKILFIFSVIKAHPQIINGCSNTCQRNPLPFKMILRVVTPVFALAARIVSIPRSVVHSSGKKLISPLYTQLSQNLLPSPLIHYWNLPILVILSLIMFIEIERLFNLLSSCNGKSWAFNN